MQSPGLGVLELILARGIISIIMLLMWMNRRVKKELIDSVDQGSMPALVFRCASGGIVQIISFQSIKNFNVSTVGMVCSLAPIICCAMAYFILGERMRKADFIFLVSVFGCVILVLLGASNSGPEVTESGGPLAFVGLLATPVLIAAQMICNKKMSKMSETVVSTYVQVTLTIVIAGLMAYQGASFTFMNEFTPTAWLLLIVSSLVNILSSTTKFQACKYQEISDL